LPFALSFIPRSIASSFDVGNTREGRKSGADAARR
jgi:hypothetical protein